MFYMDPPDHTRVRGSVKADFAPRQVADLESTIVDTANAILDRLPASGRIDIASTFGDHSRNALLFDRLWQGLSSMSHVRLYGPPPDSPRTPTLAFTIDGCTSTDAARRLSEKGLFLSHGDFYAATVVERLGLEPEGLIRAGCACYTTEEEIDRLIAGVDEISQQAVRGAL